MHVWTKWMCYGQVNITVVLNVCMYEPYIICNYDFMLPYWSPLRSIININSEPIYHPLTSPQPPGSCLQHHSPICKSQPWVRLCTKLKVISENSDYGISGSHLEFFVPVWSSKSHEISGKKPLEHWRPTIAFATVVIMLADRILAKGVTKHIPRYLLTTSVKELITIWL